MPDMRTYPQYLPRYPISDIRYENPIRCDSDIQYLEP